MVFDNSWQPGASLPILKKRAELLEKIRGFMKSHEIMEVDTPIISRYGISDPYIQSIKAVATEKEKPFYLHTSPELYMKRLLAAGAGSIYQITHVFRDEEIGKRHNPEFTMLEWYRVGFDYYQLMDDVSDLLNNIGLESPVKLTYAEAFMQTLKVNPHTVEIKQLQLLCQEKGWDTFDNDRHDLLDYLFSESVIKQLGVIKPLIIYDYPECMSALATLKSSMPVVSERFELFINNMEIANGFNELTDVNEQNSRFQAELKLREARGLAIPPVDKQFLSALESGLPKCAGIAVGIERLLMVLSGKDDIKEVNTFNLGID